MSVEKAILGELRPVIESARRELARMELEDVPPNLRRVARRSDRILPLPFARSVVEELESNEEFRGAVAKRFIAGDHHDDLLVEYLTDPGSVRIQLSDRAARTTNRGTVDRLLRAERRVVALSEQLVDAKNRVLEVRESHAAELRRTRDFGEKARRRADERNRDLSMTVSRRDDRIAELEAVVLGLERDVLDVEAKARRRDERARRQATALEATSQLATRQDTSPSDPLAFAEWLDAAERTSRPFRRRVVSGSEPTTLPSLRVPHGVVPDSREALASLIEQNPRRVVIDGYNVAGVIHGAGFSTRDARDDVIRRASQLARKTPAEIVVVFDGSDDEGRAGFRSPDGVTVRFSRGETADDAIVELVRADPSRTVVVTNDQEVWARCAFDGCVTIWSTAFI